jgi:dipeptidyl aminopeptidase/acylaminoacyl peptidase
MFWNEMSDGLYFVSDVGVNRPWFHLRLSDGACVRISEERGRHVGRYVSSARAFVFVYTNASQPDEAFTATVANLADSARWTQLSHANTHLEALPLATVDTVRWKSRDGREIEGILYKPVGYRPGERYPMIVQANGGYEHFHNNYQSYAPLLASQGYLVFMPNHRRLGSTAYGEAYKMESYAPRDFIENGTGDILSGVEYLTREGIADADRLGVMGWSIGGGTVDWLMTRTDMFKAISSGAGGGDMIAVYGQIEQYRYYYRSAWGGSAFRNWDYYADRSALRYIGQARTPTLIQVGENDDGVVAQCRETYNALREFGVPVEMLTHAGQAHILQTPQSILAKMLAEYYWFEQWIRGGASWLRWRDEFATAVALAKDGPAVVSDQHGGR